MVVLCSLLNIRFGIVGFGLERNEGEGGGCENDKIGMKRMIKLEGKNKNKGRGINALGSYLGYCFKYHMRDD